MSDHIKRELFREAARAFRCPKCAAESGKTCVNEHGKERLSVHQSRADLAKPQLDMSRVRVVGDAEAQGFVVYAIREPKTGAFGYVGQTGNFAKRIRSHARSGYRGSRTKLVIQWMHDILSAGGALEIVLLERCANEEESLALETKWVGKLAEEGNNLTNRWKTHQDIIASIRQ